MTSIQDPVISYIKKPETFIDKAGHMEWCKRLIIKNGSLNPKCPNFLFMGPPGTGKSLMALNLFYWAQQQIGAPVPYFTLECSEDTREYHLKGNFTMDGDKTPFVLGVVAAAVKAANEYGVAFLNCEEISALSPGTQKILNGLLDHRRCVSIPEAGLFLQLDEHAQPIFTSSMNPSVYGGANAINKDLMTRLQGRIHVDFPNMDDERQILKELTGADAGLIQSLILVAQLTRIKTLDFQLTTRDLRGVIENYQSTGNLKSCLEAMISCFKSNRSDYKVVEDRVNAIFDVNLSWEQESYMASNKVQKYRA